MDSGGTEVLYDPDELCPAPDPSLRPLLRAAALVVRFFCVGEALSIPLLTGTWRASAHPLPRAILRRIVKDEALHGLFNWDFLEWAGPDLSAGELELLRDVAEDAVGQVFVLWEGVKARPRAQDEEVHPLGWMATDAYLALAARSLEKQVLLPLAGHGLDIRERRSVIGGLRGYDAGPQGVRT